MAPNPWLQPKISKQDLVWLAGLLEGEGSFSEQHYHVADARSWWYALPSIELRMTDKDVVFRAGTLIGGNQRKLRSAPPARAHYKRTFIWRVNGRRAVHVMELLLPYMGKRRSRCISQLLAAYKRRVGSKGALGFTRRPKKSVKFRASPVLRRENRRRSGRRYYLKHTRPKRRRESERRRKHRSRVHTAPI